MNKIKKLSAVMVGALNVMLIGMGAWIVINAINWMFVAIKSADVSWLINTFWFERVVDTPEGYMNLTTLDWTWSLQLLGFSADLIGVIPIIIAIVILRSIFTNYRQGKVFTPVNASMYRRLGMLALIDALVVQVVSKSLLVLAASLTNAPGHRYLSLSFGTPNIQTVFISFFLIIVGWVMVEASQMQEEMQSII